MDQIDLMVRCADIYRAKLRYSEFMQKLDDLANEWLAQYENLPGWWWKPRPFEYNYEIAPSTIWERAISFKTYHERGFPLTRKVYYDRKGKRYYGAEI